MLLWQEEAPQEFRENMETYLENGYSLWKIIDRSYDEKEGMGVYRRKPVTAFIMRKLTPEAQAIKNTIDKGTALANSLKRRV